MDRQAVGHPMRRVAVLAVPAILENVMVSLVNIVDMAMVGVLGPAATAAAALNASPTWLVNSLASIVAVGVTVLVARSWGAQNQKAAGDYARQSLVLSVGLGVAIALAVQVVAPFYPIWMRAAPDVAPAATAYMRCIGLGFVPHVMCLTLYGVVRGRGDTRTPMLVSIGANLLNIAGNFFLIYPTRSVGWLGGVRVWGAGLGVAGAAIATAASMWFAGIVMLVLLAKRNDALRFGRGMAYRPQKREAANLLRVGLPSAGERIAITLGQIFFTAIVSGLGTVALSAHHLAVTAEGICYNPAFGFAAAATTMVGQALGAGDEKRAERLGRINIWLGAATMAVVSVAMYLAAPWFMRIFTPDAEVAALGAQMLRIIAFAEPLFGISIVASGALRGAADTVVPLWVGIGCMLVLRLTLAYVFVNVLGMGLAGAWYAMCADLCLRGVLLLVRFLGGKWKLRSRAMARHE